MKSISKKLPSHEGTVLLVLCKLEEGEELWESRDAPTYFVSLERDAGLKATDQEVKEEKSAKVKLDKLGEQQERLGQAEKSSIRNKGVAVDNKDSAAPVQDEQASTTAKFKGRARAQKGDRVNRKRRMRMLAQTRMEMQMPAIICQWQPRCKYAVTTYFIAC